MRRQFIIFRLKSHSALAPQRLWTLNGRIVCFFPHLIFECHSLDPPHPTPPHPKHFKAHQNTKAIRGMPSCRRGRLTLFVNCRGRCLSLFVLCTCEHKLNDNLEIRFYFSLFIIVPVLKRWVQHSCIMIWFWPAYQRLMHLILLHISASQCISCFSSCHDVVSNESRYKTTRFADMDPCLACLSLGKAALSSAYTKPIFAGLSSWRATTFRKICSNLAFQCLVYPMHSQLNLKTSSLGVLVYVVSFHVGFM